MTEAGLIDHAQLAEQTGGDADLAREVLALFRQQCDRLLPGISDGNLSARQRADLAHTLKGSALGVGGGPLAACAARIENALRASGSCPDAEIFELARLIAATLAEAG